MGRKSINEEEFLIRVKCTGYDFSITKFKNIREKIEVNCLKHGIFTILPQNMLYKDEGCPLCGIEKMSKSKSLTKQEFIEKAKKVHSDKYDYGLVKYINNKIKITIICKECGNVFKQLPLNHLQGEGCPKAQQHQQDS